MAGLGILVLPAIGGYLFLTSANHFKFTVLRRSGYHVAFASACAGLPLFIASSFVAAHFISWSAAEGSALGDYLLQIGRVAASNNDSRESDDESVEDDGSVEDVAAASALLSVPLGYIVAIGWNRLYDVHSYRKLPNSVKQSADGFWSNVRSAIKASRLTQAKLAADGRAALRELMIAEAQEEGDLVEVTLRDGKAYVGYVLYSGITRHGAEDAELALLPVFSGYRDNRGELVLTVRYAKYLDRLRGPREEAPSNAEGVHGEEPIQHGPTEAAKLRIAIAMPEVQRVRFFDFALYSPPQEGVELREIGEWIIGVDEEG